MPGGLTCILGLLLHRDLQRLVCVCLFLCFVQLSLRKCVVYAHPAVLNSLGLRGLQGRDSFSILGSI